jgi:hypothetical protein
VFGQALDDTFEEAQAFAEEFGPKWRRRIFTDVIEDFKDIERTYRFLKWHDAHPDEMEDVFYYGDYYWTARWESTYGMTEPPKEWATQYPGGALERRCGSRRRAGEDEWFTIGVYLML